MGKTKRLQELTFKSNFIFGASLLLNPDNCAGIIERATDISVGRVEVSREKSILYHPDFKGVRLDVYAKDEHNTHYDVEMQVLQKPEPGKRARYYHSQMDMELLQSGKEYMLLPECIVIFICDFDPFGYGKYRYTFGMYCEEKAGLDIGDKSQTIFLSTAGKNPQEVPESLVRFLNYVHADLEESTKDFEDDLVRQIQETVRCIKADREMEGKLMLWEEMLRDEREAAKAEGIAQGIEQGITQGITEMVLKLLEELGEVPESLKNRICRTTDAKEARRYFALALNVKSVAEFAEAMESKRSSNE